MVDSRAMRAARPSPRRPVGECEWIIAVLEDVMPDMNAQRRTGMVDDASCRTAPTSAAEGFRCRAYGILPIFRARDFQDRRTTMISRLASVTSAVALALASAAFTVPAEAARVDIAIGAPPPPQVEVVPGPRRGYLWVPGYWDWRGGRHYWVRGNWVHERRGYVYRRPGMGAGRRSLASEPRRLESLSG